MPSLRGFQPFDPISAPRSRPRKPNRVLEGMQDLAYTLTQIKMRKDEEAAAAKAEGRQQTEDQMATEDRLLQLAPLLSEFGPVSMDTGGGGAPTEGGPGPTVGADGLPIVPEGTPEQVPLGQGLAEPLLTALTLPDGRKVPIPPVRGSAERQAAEAGAQAGFKAQEGTEVLSEEVWDQLPDFWKARWQPGQRVDQKSLGAIGAQVVKDANAKSGIDKTVDLGDRVEVHYNDGRVEVKEKRSLQSANGPEDPKFTWATDQHGQRVRITEDELNSAAPGTYSDVKPSAPRTVFSGQMEQSRQKAATVLGTQGGEDSDSLWNLAMRLTIPGPSGVVGPLAKLGGVAASAARATGFGPSAADVELYGSQVEGFVPLFARAVGHSGVLTEKDVKRTERLFPVISGMHADTREVAERKMKRLERMMSGEEPVPAGMFEPQPGVWPPPDQAPGASVDLSPEETALIQRHGYGG